MSEPESVNRMGKALGKRYCQASGATLDEVLQVEAQMPEIGRVTRYAAGSGEEELLEDELVDLFVGWGYEIVPVSGWPGDEPEIKWATERAMYELRYQGANVVQLGPGRVIAFEHNVATNEALRDAGIKVFGFPGELIAMRGGGPHCLLMPLVRRD